MKQSTAMLLGMLTSKMKQIDMSSSARAIALSDAGTGILMFTKARSDARRASRADCTSRPAAAEYLVWSDRARVRAHHGTSTSVLARLVRRPR